LNIKKRFKKEKTNRKRALFICVIIMILMPYMVVVLNEQSVFGGWEYYFALAYVVLVDLLISLYLIRKFNDSKLSFQMIGRKMKIK
jgi:SNF family Na+-dependent transporter